MKKLTAILIALMLMLGANALAADDHLYSMWNEYAEKDLWGNGLTTILYADTFSSLPSKQTRSYTSDDGVILGELGWKYGGENTDAVQWIRAIAGNKRINYYMEDSVLAYLTNQKIDKSGTRFLDSQLNAWKVDYGEGVISEEIYRLQVSFNSGADVYEIMVLLVYEDEMSEFMENILIRRSGGGQTSTANPPLKDYGGLRVVNCKEWISLWSEPRSGSTRREKIPLGAILDFWEPYNDDFVHCEYNGLSGYASWDYLEWE